VPWMLFWDSHQHCWRHVKWLRKCSQFQVAAAMIWHFVSTPYPIIRVCPRNLMQIGWMVKWYQLMNKAGKGCLCGISSRSGSKIQGREEVGSGKAKRGGDWRRMHVGGFVSNGPWCVQRPESFEPALDRHNPSRQVKVNYFRLRPNLVR